MIDADAITRMVEKQIATTVNEQVLAVLTSDEWITPLEEKILQYTQDRILNKFANSTTMPEIIAAVKDSVAKLFAEGNIPGIAQFVELTQIKIAVDQAIEHFIQIAIEQFSQDPAWQARVERMINQTVVHETMSRLSSIDLNPTIKQRVDENMQQFTDSLLKNFASTGISDLASQCELTVMDGAVVAENSLTSKNLQVIDAAEIQHLVVTGSINTDNQSWSALSADISQRTLDALTDSWQATLIKQVATHIQAQGIEFEQVLLGGEKLLHEGKLSRAITDSNIQSVGTLRTLQVQGEASFNKNTMHVMNKRVGVNTDTPEKALSVWDEEVSIVIGKHQSNQAYVGTNRDQGLVIGTNRQPQIEISADGLTAVRRLQVGAYKIGHDTRVPGWSGTRGDIIFNTDPGADLVFAWQCLGGLRWQAIKGAK